MDLLVGRGSRGGGWRKTFTQFPRIYRSWWSPQLLYSTRSCRHRPARMARGGYPSAGCRGCWFWGALVDTGYISAVAGGTQARTVCWAPTGSAVTKSTRVSPIDFKQLRERGWCWCRSNLRKNQAQTKSNIKDCGAFLSWHVPSSWSAILSVSSLNWMNARLNEPDKMSTCTLKCSEFTRRAKRATSWTGNVKPDHLFLLERQKAQSSLRCTLSTCYAIVCIMM